MIFNNYIYDVNLFKKNVISDANKYAKHNSRNFTNNIDIKLSLINHLKDINYNLEEESVFILHECIDINYNYLNTVLLLKDSFLIDLEKGITKYQKNNKSTYNNKQIFLDKSICKCKFCEKLNNSCKKLNNFKLNNLIYTLNL